MGKGEKQLAEAINIATTVHHRQFDKAGMPYILHPLHLMNSFMDDLELAAIAVLHDVIEDGGVDISLCTLRSCMSERVVDAVDHLTHADGETYDDYITRVSENFDAVRVKLADLLHNSDETRLKRVTNKDIARRQKYNRAYLRLTALHS